MTTSIHGHGSVFSKFYNIYIANNSLVTSQLSPAITKFILTQNIISIQE